MGYCCGPQRDASTPRLIHTLSPHDRADYSLSFGNGNVARRNQRLALGLSLTSIFGGTVATTHAEAKKTNIVVIMGDDIGLWNIGAHHRGLMAGKTPNLDKLAKEGMVFTDYHAEASCTGVGPTLLPGSFPFGPA